ncbi:hypothetical protein BTR22_19015 [Alkalihalophilus pseudofirmus]|uniref:helix-turn-helix transcriptional regulator n=1 Tax=Alkalihalophilus pseudofirmus TaxID=79885 RepID=UPI0009523B70|nr:hypothetical protein BTR22_19015 [Alkalihalophilus pseudofirmus]
MDITNVEKRRQQLGIQKGWLAEQVEISRGAMGKILSGESKPTLIVALKIAHALNAPVEDLWGSLIESWKDEYNIKIK